MIRKLYLFIKFEFQRFIKFCKLLSDFSVSEAKQLSYFKTTKNPNLRILVFNPRSWTNSIKIRDDFRDKRTVQDVFLRKYHLPVNNLLNQKDVTILDLGSNLGATIADYKNLYPEITVFGYEMDKDNYELSLENTINFKNVTIENKAIWTQSTIVEFKKDKNYDGYSLNTKSESKNTTVQSITISEIIKKHNISSIDYLKMDIEGTEKDILNDQNLDWLNTVQELNIEMHNTTNKELEDYIFMLNTKGFKAWKDDNHSSAIRAVKNRPS